MPGMGLHQMGQARFGSFRATPGSRKFRTLGDGTFTRQDILSTPSAKVLVEGLEGKDAVVAYVVANGGLLFEGKDMGITAALKEALEKTITAWDLKLYIQDNNGNWVDFTDRSQWRGKDQLRKMGNFTYSAERHIGAVQQSLPQVVLENSDGFWDRPMPVDLKASFDENWLQLTTTTAASFSLSTGGQESVLFRHKVALRAHYQTTGSTAPSTVTMGVFLLDDITTDQKNRSATLRLVPMSHLLINNNADDVKDGTDWYMNKPPSFLVDKIVRKEFANSTGNLPSTYDVDQIPEIEVPLPGTSAWIASSFGRPPEHTYENSGGTLSTTATWLNDRRVCRALKLWEHTDGTIAVTVGSAVVTGTSTNWATTGAGAIRVGDAFIVQKEYASGDGGSQSDHNGKYTVLSVNVAGQLITLDRPIAGTADESGLSYTIPRLYLGVGSELYEYNIATDIYSQLTTGPTEIGANYEIRRIWHNTNDVTYPIWGIALTFPTESDRSHSMKVFRFRWNGDSPDVDIFDMTDGGAVTEIPDVTLGEHVYRNGDKQGGSPGARRLIGNFTGGSGIPESAHAPIVIPYEQKVVNTLQVAYQLYKEDVFGSQPSIVNDTNEYGSLFKYILPTGYYHAESIDLEMKLRYSMGQQGCCLYVDSFSTNGAIVFVEITDPAVDANNGQDNQPLFAYSYRYIDLADGNVYDMTAAHFTTYTNYLPTCGDVDSSGNVYIGMTLHRRSVSETLTTVLRIQTIAASATVQRLYKETTGDAINVLPLEMLYVAAASTPDATARLFFSTVNIANFGTSSDQYSIRALLPATTDQAAFTTKTGSVLPLQGLTLIQLGSSQANDSRIMHHSPRRGTINLATTGSAVGEITTLASTLRTHLGEDYAFSNHVSSSVMKESYWISGLFPTTNLTEESQGKFYLSKWSNTMPIRVELADFEGISLWNALRHIADLSDARFGFRPDGNFYFKKRPKDASSTYTLTNIGGNKIADIAKSSGQSDILNYSVRSPARVVVGDINVTQDLEAVSGASQGNEHFIIDATQRGNRATSIRLVCVDSGRVARTDETGVEARFKYLVTRGTSSSTLSSAYGSSDKWIFIEDPEDIIYGSLVDATGVNGSGVEVTGNARVGFKCTYNSGVALLTDENLADFPGVTVDRDGSDIPFKLSSGSVDMTQPLDNGYTLVQGDIIAIGHEGDEDKWEYLSIIQVNAASIIASRGIIADRGSIDHAPGENVYLIRHGRQVFTNSVDPLSITDNFSIGTKVKIDHPDTDVWSTRFTKDPNDSTSSLTELHAYFVPTKNKFIWIGGENTAHSTGIALQFTWNGTADRGDEPKFSVGDIIRVEAPGLELERDSASTQTFSDMASIARWGKRENQSGRDNPYMNHLMVQWVGRREVQDRAEPRRIYRVQTLLAPWLLPLSRITLQDPDVLPTAKQRQEVCYITSMTFDMLTRGAVTLTLRGINAY